MNRLQNLLILVTLVTLGNCSNQDIINSTPSSTQSPSPFSSPASVPPSSPSPSPENPVIAPRPHFRVFRLVSTCFYGNLRECVAGYGFSVDQFGNYGIGPSPENKRFLGSLAEEEFEAIKEFFGFENPTPVFKVTGDICVTGEPIALTQDGTFLDSALAFDPYVCFRNLPTDKAKILFDYLRKLASKYYPLPFFH